MSDDSPRLSIREIQTISARIATILGENDTEPLTQIRGLLRRLGDGFVLETLEEAQQLEREGGMLVPDGSRSRTLGGIFFYLVKGKLIRNRRYADLAAVFPAFAASRHQDGAAASQPELLIKMAWNERGEVIQSMSSAPGKAATVKVTVIGRPQNVVERANTVLAMMKHTGPLPPLPKGLPVPNPLPATTYVLYISPKQWRGIKEALQNPEDVLIAEGVQLYDADYQAITVFVTNATTKLLQRARRTSGGEAGQAHSE